MDEQSSVVEPESIHPALWRASQLGRASAKCVDTGHAALSLQLPGRGWPPGALTELLLSQPGIGEMRLLAPALAKVAKRRIVLIEPPHPPQILAFASLGVAPEQVIWLRAKTTADKLWAAEQVLSSGSCGALLMWHAHARSAQLQRLHLAAQSGETLCFAFRPLEAAQDASIAPLRLSLRPAAGGINVDFVKRRGPSTDQTVFLPLSIGSAFRPSPYRHTDTGHPAPVHEKNRNTVQEFV